MFFLDVAQLVRYLALLSISHGVLCVDAPYVTVDGKDCELPVFYMGAVHTKCIPVNGKPMCLAKDGEWKGCKPLGDKSASSKDKSPKVKLLFMFQMPRRALCG